MKKPGETAMRQNITAGIVGYGNLGKGVEMALQQNPDFHLEAIFM